MKLCPHLFHLIKSPVMDIEARIKLVSTTPPEEIAFEEVIQATNKADSR